MDVAAWGGKAALPGPRKHAGGWGGGAAGTQILPAGSIARPTGCSEAGFVVRQEHPCGPGEGKAGFWMAARSRGAGGSSGGDVSRSGAAVFAPQSIACVPVP